MEIIDHGKELYPTATANCPNTLCNAKFKVNAREVNLKVFGRSSSYVCICPKCGRDVEIPYRDLSDEFFTEMKVLKGWH